MIAVTQEEFFSYVGPRDIVPSNANPEYTVWETRHRVEVGRSYPGWRNPGEPARYLLTEAAHSALKVAA
jgi:hypothetical protein